MVGLYEIVYLLTCATKTDDEAAENLNVRGCAQAQGAVEYNFIFDNSEDSTSI